ncbi:MAG: sodium-independent anion transporter, partial [Geminicoccaceae bacterium]
NIKRHKVLTNPAICTIRVDESLYFANARYLEDIIYDRVADDPDLNHVILMCSAVNEIDSSALDSLEAIVDRLNDRGIAFHLSEVKGPVMDRLQQTSFLKRLTGHVFLSQFQAANQLGRPIDHQAADVLKTAS